MNGYRHKTRGHPSIKQLLAFLLALIVLVATTPPDLAKADNNFTLTAITNATANNGLGNVELDWSGYTNNAIFKGYQSKDNGKTWQTISLMNYTSVKEVKVLNVYPDVGDNLKTWMEDNKDSLSGQIIGKGIIKVDKVSIYDFNVEPNKYLYKTNGAWNYNVIVFGFWDNNNFTDLSALSKNTVNSFISDGGGCVFGHDVALCNNSMAYETRNGTKKARQYNFDELASKYFPFMTFKYAWNGSSTVTISKKGLFTSYPWKLGEIGTKYTIPSSHTWGQQLSDTSNVWVTFGDSPVATSDNFYLVTNNNCAMIMTGHSKGQSTEAEQKLLANLLFYCYQISSGTSVTDNSAMDNAAPDKPTVVRNEGNFVLTSKDNGVTYQHKIEAYDPINTSTLIGTSNVVTNTITSGFKEYRYIYDNSTDTKITRVNGTAITNGIIPYDSRYGYLHVAAVDNAGNVCETTTIEMSLHQITYKTDTIYPSDTTAEGIAGGKITRTSETVAGNSVPLGSTATAYNIYTFDGWYSSSGELITKDATIKPLNCNAEEKGGFIYPSYGGSSVYDASTDTYMVTTDMSTEEGTAKESWGSGVHHIGAEIPWNNWYIAEFEVWSPIDAECVIDINNWGPNGHSWNGNDNDNAETRFYKQNGTSPAFSLKANTWKKIVIWYQNSSSKNTNHESLWDQHTINLRYNKSLGNQTFKIRNYKAAVSPTLVKELDTFTARFKPWEHTVAYDANGGTGTPASGIKYAQSYFNISKIIPTREGYTFKNWNTKKDGTGTTYNPGQNYELDQNGGTVTLYAQWQYNPVSIKIPQTIIGDSKGNSQFRVKCDDLKAGSIKVTVPNSFLYKQTGKTDVTASITAKSGNNTIAPTNKVCVYDITTKNGLSAGCWQGNFNIRLTLTKE